MAIALRAMSDRIAITALQGKVEGVRRQSRPRATWMSEIEGRENLTLLQSSLIAQNRARWKELEEIVGADVRPTRKRA